MGFEKRVSKLEGKTIVAVGQTNRSIELHLDDGTGLVIEAHHCAVEMPFMGYLVKRPGDFWNEVQESIWTPYPRKDEGE